MSVISGIPGSAHLCREPWKSPTGYLKLSSVSHTAVKYVHFTLAAAILDFWRMLTSRDTGSCTIETLDTENMGIAVEILLLCAVKFEIWLGVKIPQLPANVAKKRCRDKGFKRWCMSAVWCLPVAYIGPKSRTERPWKTKIGTDVAHVARDSDTFKVKRAKVNLQRAWAFCGGLPPCLLVFSIYNCCM